MPGKNEGILESGYWEDVKPDAPAAGAGSRIYNVWNNIRPSFLSRAGIQGPDTKGIVRPTAWLDGLRGFAALLVFIQHHTLWTHDPRILENGFGHKDAYYFGCFPFVRLLFSGGHFSVAVFFIISGYVLSVKPLSLIYTSEHLKLSDNLASALFRRWIRLFLPVIVTTFLYMSTWHVLGILTFSPDPVLREKNWWDEIWSWYYEFKNFTFAFRTGGEIWFNYNVHLWSIPIEFRGSIIVYTALLAFSRCTRNARLWCEVGLMYYFMYIADGWYGSLFMGGVLLCDLEQLARHNDLPKIFSYFEPYKDLIFYNMFIASLYLGGVPAHTDKLEDLRPIYGWYYISFLKPQAVFDYKWHILMWASLFIITSIPKIGWLKRFFELRFNQYLGRISYSLYLVHGPVLWIVGDRLYVACGFQKFYHFGDGGLPNWINKIPLPKQGIYGWELNFLIPFIFVMTPFTFWIAELCTNYVDEPSVRFAQWCYRCTLGNNRALATAAPRRASAAGNGHARVASMGGSKA